MVEVHARPVELVPEVCRIRRLVFVVPANLCVMQTVFDRFCQRHGEDANVDGTVRRQCSFPARRKHVTCEFYSEFITVTWRSELADPIDWPDDLGLDVVQAQRQAGRLGPPSWPGIGRTPRSCFRQSPDAACQ